MSHINELIQQFCPGGVEFKALGELTSIRRGKRLVKSQLDASGEFPVFQNSLTPLGYYHESNVQGGTAFVIAAGAAGEIGYSPSDFWAADDVYVATDTANLEQKYLYHILLMKKGTLSGQVRRASIPRLSKSAIERLEIPVPPLEVQREIVRVLDQFTQLETELETELEARRKQYEYYRDQLLTFNSLTDAERERERERSGGSR